MPSQMGKRLGKRKYNNTNFKRKQQSELGACSAARRSVWEVNASQQHTTP